MAFCVWLLSPLIMFIHVANRTLFFNGLFIEWKDHILLVHSHPSTLVGVAGGGALTIKVRVYFWTLSSIPLISMTTLQLCSKFLNRE